MKQSFHIRVGTTRCPAHQGLFMIVMCSTNLGGEILSVAIQLEVFRATKIQHSEANPWLICAL